MNNDNIGATPFSFPFLILAAGYGSRLESKTHQSPKCLLPLSSRNATSLSLLLDAIISNHPNQIFITGGHRFEELQNYLNKNYHDFFNLQLIDARPSFSNGPLYSFLSAESYLSNYSLFWLFPADTIFTPSFFRWFQSLKIISDRIHIFIRSSLIEESEILSIVKNMKENIPNNEKFPFLPYMLPILGFPGSIYLPARKSQSHGGKKVIDLFPFVNNLSDILQIHFVPNEYESILDLDSEYDFNQCEIFISNFWGNYNERRQ